MAQVAREKALARFREDKLQVLVATDVAARGIDVAGVSHVINYTCPEDDKTYVHRIGRTGRAGATGTAITFVDWADLHRWKMINKTLDLPFDDPQETYSTSEHLYHDQGIAPGTKGRIVDPSAAGEREPRDRVATEAAAAGAQPRRGPSRARRPPAARRNRTRSRSGQSVTARPLPLPGGSRRTPASRAPGSAAAGVDRARRRRPQATTTAYPASAASRPESSRRGPASPGTPVRLPDRVRP